LESDVHSPATPGEKAITEKTEGKSTELMKILDAEKNLQRGFRFMVWCRLTIIQQTIRSYIGGLYRSSGWSPLANHLFVHRQVLLETRQHLYSSTGLLETEDLRPYRPARRPLIS